MSTWDLRMGPYLEMGLCRYSSKVTDESYWIEAGGQPYSSVVIFIRETETQTDPQGECHVSMKPEIGLIQLQAQEHQGLLARPEA